MSDERNLLLIVKGLENLPCANSLFSQTGIKITTEGERHLGAVIGSERFKIKNKTNFSRIKQILLNINYSDKIR